MAKKFHVVVEFDVDLVAEDGYSHSLGEALAIEVKKADYTVVEINGIKFDKERFFSECVWCDGCDDNLDTDERNALIIPELLAAKEA